MGKIKIKRLRYVCDSCGHNIYPFDSVIDIGRSRISKGFTKAMSLVFIFVPFEHTRKFIFDLLGFTVSGTCLKETSQKIGSKLAANAELEDNSNNSVENKKEDEILYIQADGAMVPISKAVKREFKENKLGVIFSSSDIEEKISKNGKSRTKIKNKRFVSSIGEGVTKFKKLLYLASIKKGLKHAKKIIFISDGASWLSKCKAEYFPDAIQILDWYHAVEHLWTTAKKLFGEKNQKKCETWVSSYKEMLWHGKIIEVIEKIYQEAKQRKRNQTPLWELYTYFNNNKNNMNYAEYRENGYYFGSGVIESANKYIVANRLKLAGMRWTLKGANSIIWLRCKYFEDNWDEFWEEMKLSEYLCKGSYNMKFSGQAA